MRLNADESAMLAGNAGPARQWAINHQMRVGRYLGAADFVPVSQAHIMADTESLGVAGVEWLERLAALPDNARCVRIPTITDPRGTDFAAAARLKQQDWMLAPGTSRDNSLRITRRADDRHLHQLPDDHASRTWRTHGIRRYRRGDLCQQRARCTIELRGWTFGTGRRTDRADAALRLPSAGETSCNAAAAYRIHAARTARLGRAWRNLGRYAGDYWQVPALVGIDRIPTSDEMKHFGAALASYGSVALFHMVGITPEAERLADIADPSLTPTATITEPDLRTFQDAYRRRVDKVDVVVFSTPQLSLLELRDLAGMLTAGAPLYHCSW